MEKIKRDREKVKKKNNSKKVIYSNGKNRMVVGKWELESRKEGEMKIKNYDGKKKEKILREDIKGLIFE